MEKHDYDVIVIGSGMAGLTAAAFLVKDHHRVLLLEKETDYGGLLGAFKVDGHWLDKGARGIIDSGIIFPMLRQLGLDVEFVANPIKMVFDQYTLDLTSKASLKEYSEILTKLFPTESHNIQSIMADIDKVMQHMDVLYGIENPLFLTRPFPLSYLTKTLLPWVAKMLYHMPQANKYMIPVDEYLKTKTDNQQLIDIISQHFFAKTPALFALSYFTLYLQYHYPIGSTQSIIDGLVGYCQTNNVDLKSQTEVVAIDYATNQVIDQHGITYHYRQLLWAADTTKLYDCLCAGQSPSMAMIEKLSAHRSWLKQQIGADSILTLYLLSDLPPSYFANSVGPHAFYTPKLKGLSSMPISEIKDSTGKFVEDKRLLFDWIKQNLINNTIEISIPALRDDKLSPMGKSALIVSVLFDYHLTDHLINCGYYEEFKLLITKNFITILEEGLWSGFSDHVERTLVSTPKTIFDKTYAHQGSVTGWSFINHPLPAESRFLKVNNSVKTLVPNIKQAGQFTFNPAGVPIAALTGKLAADAVHQALNRRK